MAKVRARNPDRRPTIGLAATTPQPALTNPALASNKPVSPAPPLAIIEPLCAVFRRHLRRLGLKYTVERARVLEAVIDAPGPFMVESVLAKLQRQRPRVSKATAYRTIKLLEESGIVQKLLLTADQAHYQLAYSARGGLAPQTAGDHAQAHSDPGDEAVLVRTDTDELGSALVPGLGALVAQVAQRHGLRVDGHRLVIYVRA
jgi:Fur family ferric uptake transcriptional regulator